MTEYVHEWKEEWSSDIGAMEIICRACPVAHHPSYDEILTALNATEMLSAEMVRDHEPYLGMRWSSEGWGPFSRALVAYAEARGE